MNKFDANKPGALFVVATPLGNLGDLSPRAGECLRRADLILAEDTRRAKILLQHIGARGKVQSLHEHNERKKIAGVVRRIRAGEQAALISDAGTPLISDPGFLLVRELRELGLPVFTVPGACALTAALSVCGVEAERFCFEGFLPAKSAARKKSLQGLAGESRAMVFYESGRRVVAALHDMAAVFGDARMACAAREMTKKFERYYRGELREVARQIAAGATHQKGEFVIVVAGAPHAALDAEKIDRAMQLLAQELPLKKAAAVVAQLFDANKNALYRRALKSRG